jgi:GNAT superfamily N-acetyltransferase
VVEELTRLVNAAYAAGEQGLWEPGTPRISPDSLRALVDAGELLLVERDGAPAGCVRVGVLDADTAELGLLSAARAGSGVGRELVDRAEAWARERGRSRMRLQLLVPREGTHPFKTRLHDWYTRLGYAPVGREPAAFPGLAVPCELVSYEKAL